MKKCNKCNIFKELTEFTIDRLNKDGLKQRCKECIKPVKRNTRQKNKKHYNEYHKQWCKLNPKKHSKRVKKVNLRKKYNITLEQYDLMVLTQNNLCSICKKPENIVDKKAKKIRALAIDHNHITGKVRELLCQRCNMGIGLLNLDNGPELLLAAIEYYNRTK